MRWPLVIAVLSGAVVLLTVAPAGSPAPSSARAHASCKYVIKVVHGYRHRVRICHRDKPVADLSVSVTSTLERVTAGNQVAYTVQVKNHGPKAADNVVISIDVPADEVYLYGYGGAGSIQCNTASSDTGKTIECSILTLEPEETGDTGSVEIEPPFAIITILAEPDEAGSFATVAGATSDARDPHPEDNRVSSQLTVLPGPASADLSVTMRGAPNPASVPDGFTETISVTNRGPSETTTAYVTMLLPQGTTVMDVTGLPARTDIPIFTGLCPPFYVYGQPSTITLCWDVIESGQTRTATVELAPSAHAPPTLETNAVVSAYAQDPDLGNNRTSDVIALAPFHPPPGVDLIASLKAPEGPVVGRNFAVGFRVANLGLDTAHDVHFKIAVTPEFQGGIADLRISGRDLTPADISCVSGELPIDCTISSLGSGERIVGSIGGSVTTAGSYSATFTTSSTSTDSNPGDDTARVTFDVRPSQALR